MTGLSISGDELKLPRKTKRELKQEIHYIKTFGYISHISKNKISNPYYLESLIGKVNFWLQAEPDNLFAKDSLNHLLEIKRSALS